MTCKRLAHLLPPCFWIGPTAFPGLNFAANTPYSSGDRSKSVELACMRGSIKLAAGAVALAALVIPPAAAQLGTTGDVEATTADLERAATETTVGRDSDPWEGFNRKMFAVHLVIDDIVLVPAARAYRAVSTKKSRKGVRNFLSNAQTPNVLFNDLLQGEFKRAGKTTGRFIINSTIGFLGFADPAAKLGVSGHSEDFGQTLAVWGLPSGPYLFLPFFGPSSLRDGFGLAADTVAEPLFWVRTDAAKYARYSRAGATALARREPVIEPLEDIEAKSLDYYASFRSFYLQARRREIANGRIDYDDLPDIGEYEEFDELK